MGSEKEVYCEGSVRVDLLGGTLDLYPLNHHYQELYTLNMATSLKAKVRILSSSEDSVTVSSMNYKKEESFPLQLNFFKDNVFIRDSYQEFTFVLLIINFFKLEEGVKIELDSDAPAGSGLGGSSSLGVVLFQALCEWTGRPFHKEEAVKVVRDLESMILGQGVPGYQDYYPALWGGILALRPSSGEIICEQLFDSSLKEFLEKNLLLLYSGVQRNSGINNWDVYKNFFDEKSEVVMAMDQIAKLTVEAYRCMKEQDYKRLLELIVLEGRERKKLSPSILNSEMQDLERSLNGLKKSHVGLKVCGAGGGGCFLVCGLDEEEIKEFTERGSFQILDLRIEGPKSEC